MTSRVEHIGDATLYLGDCREVLPTLECADAIVTDPPYGVGRDKGNETRRGAGFYPTTQIRRSYNDIWDKRPDSELLKFIIKFADVAIIWGANYFASVLPENGRWLVWDKQNTMPSFSDCELAWTNLSQNSVKVFRYSNNGLLAREKDRVHPTQKPVQLMKWCLGMLPQKYNRIILDPFMGSGTTGVAAIQLGRRFVGVELEMRYFDIACRRIEETARQGRLAFDEATDAIGSYHDAIRACGERHKAGEPLGQFFLPLKDGP